jgi:hypothetical protein
LKLIKITTLHGILETMPLQIGFRLHWAIIRPNFDVVIRPNFDVATVNHEENFLALNTLKLPPMEVDMGEAHAVLLASGIAVSFGCPCLIIEVDSVLTILAIKDPHLFLDWNLTPVISNIQLQLLFIPY